MEIERHLSKEELGILLSFPEDDSDPKIRVTREAAGIHIGRCERCQSEYDLMLRKLSALPEAIHAASDQPQFFWQRQQAAIRSRIAIEEASHRGWRGFVLATVASLILLAVLLLNGTRTSPKPQIQVQADPDQELLMAVERAVNSGVPESLAPAALLAEDISSAVETSPATLRNSKEKQNEN